MNESNSNLIENEISSIIDDKELIEKRKKVKPLKVIGHLSKKIQYSIVGGLFLLGVGGCVIDYFTEQNKIKSVNEINLLKKELTSIVEKTQLYVDDFKGENYKFLSNFSNDFTSLNVKYDLLSKNDFYDEFLYSKYLELNQNIRNLDNYLKQTSINEKNKTNIINVNNEIIEQLKKINDVFSNENSINILVNLNKISYDLIELNDTLENIHPQNLRNIWMKTQSIYKNFDNLNQEIKDNISGTITSFYNAIFSKFEINNKSILAYLKRYNDIQKLNVDFPKIEKSLEEFKLNLTDINLNNEHNKILLIISLILISLSFILLTLILMKDFEMEKEIETAKGVLLAENIEEIYTDLKMITEGNKKHRPSSSYKVKRVNSLVEVINIILNQNQKTMEDLLSLIDKVKDFNDKNDKFNSKIVAVENQVIENNKVNIKQLENFSKFKKSFDEYQNYYSHNYPFIKDTNKELNNTYQDNIKSYEDMENSLSLIKEKITTLYDLAKNLEEYGKNAIEVSAKAKVLSLNSDIVARKEKSSHAFLEISKNINENSNKFLLVAENVKNISNNILTSFENINSLIKDISKKLNDDKKVAISFNKKIKNTISINDQFNKWSERLNLLIDDVDVLTLKNNIDLITQENQKLLEDEVKPNAFLNKTNESTLKEIEDKLNDEVGKNA